MQLCPENSWKKHLENEFAKPYFISLQEFLQTDYAEQTCYPPRDLIFSAFNSCAFEQVKVVILGQDPYHGQGQANGLCFSVQDGIRKPPSLVNIFKEIKSDLGIEIPQSGNLARWARQGVLLLNATLTVRENSAGSHQNKGWEIFTDKVIELINDQHKNCVFLLWGSFAQKKGKVIDESKHLVLKSVHPSPLSAYNGFFGNHHFSRTNDYLKDHGKDPVVW